MARHVVASLPAEIRSPRRRALRVLDPSMESGQLLTALVLEILNDQGTSTSGSLDVRSVICDGLVGVDRHPDAVGTVRLLLTSLAMVNGLGHVAPKKLIRADALELVEGEELGAFDALVNNPPWGFRSDHIDRTVVRRFDSTTHHGNPYIAFIDIGLRRLKRGAPFAFVVPTQALTARNSARLRETLLEASHIERLVILPRRAFTDATVRAALILGRKAGAKQTSSFIQVIRYTPVHKLGCSIKPVEAHLRSDHLAAAGRKSWSAILASRDVPSLCRSAVPLATFSRIFSGLKPYRVGRGSPPQTRETVSRKPFTHSQPIPEATPVVRGRDVREYAIHSASEYVRVGPWLAEPGPHLDCAQTPRVFVRELYRRDGKLTAAVAVPGWIARHGVLTVVPNSLPPETLAVLLNSNWITR
jgi:hypothetical protein